eukprot:tig00020614_g12197.t1
MARIDLEEEEEEALRHLQRIYGEVDRLSHLRWSHREGDECEGGLRSARAKQTRKRLLRLAREEELNGRVSQGYGEMTLSSVGELLAWLSEPPEEFRAAGLALGSDSTFVDIGSGFGKVVFHAVLQCDVKAAHGVEYVSSRVEAAEKVKRKFFEEYGDRIRFFAGDANLRPSFDYTHIYMYDRIFFEETYEKLCPKLEESDFSVLVSYRDTAFLRRFGLLHIDLIHKMSLRSTGRQNFTAYIYRKKQAPREEVLAARAEWRRRRQAELEASPPKPRPKGRAVAAAASILARIQHAHGQRPPHAPPPPRAASRPPRLQRAKREAAAAAAAAAAVQRRRVAGAKAAGRAGRGGGPRPRRGLGASQKRPRPRPLEVHWRRLRRRIAEGWGVAPPDAPGLPGPVEAEEEGGAGRGAGRGLFGPPSLLDAALAAPRPRPPFARAPRGRTPSFSAATRAATTRRGGGRARRPRRPPRPHPAPPREPGFGPRPAAPPPVFGAGLAPRRPPGPRAVEWQRGAGRGPVAGGWESGESGDEALPEGLLAFHDWPRPAGDVSGTAASLRVPEPPARARARLP